MYICWYPKHMALYIYLCVRLLLKIPGYSILYFSVTLQIFMCIASWSYKIIWRSKLNDRFHLRFKSGISLRFYDISDLNQFCYLGEVLGSAVSVISGLQGNMRKFYCPRMCYRADFTQIWRLGGDQDFHISSLKNLSFLHTLIFLKFLSLKINVYDNSKCKVRFTATAYLCCPWKETC